MRHAHLLLVVVLLVAACSDEAPIRSADDPSDAAGDLEADDLDARDVPTDPGRDQASTDAGFTDEPCSQHSECPCPEGICVSTGVCWCPPCRSHEDCPTGESCASGECRPTPPECEGPLRISPTSGPSTGGTRLTVQGIQFYIGALEWWGQIGGGTAMHPVYGAVSYDPLPCSLTFITPPAEPGTYPVQVWYGGPPPDSAEGGGRGGDAGSFTYVESDEFAGGDPCRSDAQCADPLERCDLGLGHCVTDLCQSLYCEGGRCDPVEGCLDDGCESDADCQLVSGDCTCDARPAGNGSTTIDRCFMGGCLSCEAQVCEAEHIEPICVGGVCTEQRGDPEGAWCPELVFAELPGSVSSGDFIREPTAAVSGTDALLAWTEPTQAGFRNGLVRAVTVNADGNALGDILTLDTENALDSNPAVAATPSGWGVVWLGERSPASLMFQALAADGSPLGAAVVVDERIDEFLNPYLFSDDDGLRAFWAVKDYGAEDGLYVAGLSANGALEGETEHLPWVGPSLDDFAVSPWRDERWMLAWRNTIHGREGLYATPYPLSARPVRQLSETGVDTAVASMDTRYAVAWRESTSGTSPRSRIYLATFDQDEQPLISANPVSRGTLIALEPRVAYLSGHFVVTWLERDSHEAGSPYRLMGYVTGQGQSSGGQILAEGLDEYPGHTLIRRGDSILGAWVDTGGGADVMRFGTFDCAD